MQKYTELAERARIAQANGKWSVALGLWKQAFMQQPTIHNIHGVATALEKTGHYAGARDLYAKASDLYINDENRAPAIISFSSGLARVSEKLGDWETAATQWQNVVALEPDNHKWQIQLARAQMHLGLYDDYIETLRQAKIRWPDNTHITNLYLDAERKYSDKVQPLNISISDFGNKDIGFTACWHLFQEQVANATETQLVEMLEVLCSTWNDKPLPLRQLAKHYFSRSKYQKALECYLKLEILDSKMQTDIFNISVCLIALGCNEEAKDKLMQYVADCHDGFVLQKHIGQFLNEAQNTNIAKEILTEVLAYIKKSGGSDAMRQQVDLEPMLEFHRSLKKPTRPVITNWGDRVEVVSSAPSPSGDVFLLFSGFAHHTGFVPVELIDRFLAGHGASMIRLVDASGNLYQNGISQLAPNLDTTIFKLKEIIKGLGANRIFTIGTSGGGFGALRYGIELNAENILLYSPPTNLQMSFLRENNDFRARAVIRRVNRDLTPEQLDMYALLKNSPHKPRIDAYFSADNPGDRAQVMNIADLPNVYSHQIEGVEDHDTISSAFARGYLQKDLESMIGIYSANIFIKHSGIVDDA